MKVSVNWQGNMTLTGTSPSGFPVQMDADSSYGGTDSGVRPMEMIALGLAGCTAMDVLSILRKKRQRVTRFEVKVDMPRAKEHPKVFTSAVIKYIFTGNDIEELAVLRALELSATKYCPAQFMFGQLFPIELQYEIYEAEENGDRRLSHQGAWQETGQE